jgi:hypothetical protein
MPDYFPENNAYLFSHPIILTALRTVLVVVGGAPKYPKVVMGGGAPKYFLWATIA